MKLRIENIGNTLDCGTLTTAKNIICKLKEHDNELEILVDVKTEKDLNRIKKESGLRSIYPIDSEIRAINGGMVKRRRSVSLRGIDATLFVGGSQLSSENSTKALEKKLREIHRLDLDKKVIFVGQDIGPFLDEENILLANDIFKRCYIYTRTDSNYDYLNQFGLKNIKRGRDLSFLKVNNDNEFIHEDTLERYNLIKDKYFTIVPSGDYKKFIENVNYYIKQYVEIINGILSTNIFRDYKIVLMPYDTSSHDSDDRNIINEIMLKIKDEYKANIVSINDELMSSQIQEILANDVLTISSRVYASAESFKNGKPAITLCTKKREMKMIDECIKLENLSVEINDYTKWMNGEVSQEVFKRINYIIKKYEVMLKKIEKQANIASTVVDYELNDLCKELNSDDVKEMKVIGSVG